MDKDILLKASGLFLAAFCLIGFIIWNVSNSDRLEKNLFSELDEVAELDNELCPFDGRLTKTSRVILFDFSDPLPTELNHYPSKLLDNMMMELQNADRFDRFSMYTLNPYGETPKDINTFCVPVTLNQIPREIRKALWGKDPQQHSELPSRYQRFANVFERLWENEQELKESMNESVNTLANQAKNAQSYSRIIENIEEIAGSEIDRNSQKINVIVFSDMLQNSPQYSHYKDSWDFKEYLPKRTHALVNMERFSFEIYFVQSCIAQVTNRRRALQKFWNDYFSSSNASVKINLLSVDGSSCLTESSTKAVNNSASVRETKANSAHKQGHALARSKKYGLVVIASEVNGFWCDEEIQLYFNVEKYDFFINSVFSMTKTIGNKVLPNECPIASTIKIQGFVSNSDVIVFEGVASKQNAWSITQ